MDFRQKIALVTGGGTGIGRATSMALAERGTAVAVNYSKSAKDAEETVELIRQQGGKAIAVKADVSRDEEVSAMVKQIVETYGGLDLLVNNASTTRHIPLDDLDAVTDECWDEMFAVNVKGMFHCARAAARAMHAGGAIVNIGSIAGSTGNGSSLPYAVSKAAVHGLTKSLARALAPSVRVNCIIPGAVLTRWWAGREEKMKQLAPQLLLKRIATPEDIAEAIVSALAVDGMTGQLITVDSGQTL